MSGATDPVPADVPALGVEDVPGLGGTEPVGVGVGVGVDVGVGDTSPGDVLLGRAEGDRLGAGL